MSTVIRSLDTLFPPFAEQVAKAARKMTELDLYVFETYRSLERQLDRFSQGRTQQNGIWVVTNSKAVVTNAKPGMGFHTYGLAFDAVPDGDQTKIGMQWSWKDTYIDATGKTQKVNWAAYGKIVKSLGMEWAGNWTNFKEYPHAQNRYGFKASDLYQILINEGLESVWKRIYAKLPPTTRSRVIVPLSLEMRPPVIVTVPVMIENKPQPIAPVVAAEDFDGHLAASDRPWILNLFRRQ